jgi:hypothetical protein
MVRVKGGRGGGGGSDVSSSSPFLGRLFDAAPIFLGAALFLGGAFCFLAAGSGVSSFVGVALRLSAGVVFFFFFSAVPCFALVCSVALSSGASGPGVCISFFSMISSSSSMAGVSASSVCLLFDIRGELSISVVTVYLESIPSASSTLVGVVGEVTRMEGGDELLALRLGGVAALWLVCRMIFGSR